MDQTEDTTNQMSKAREAALYGNIPPAKPDVRNGVLQAAPPAGGFTMTGDLATLFKAIAAAQSKFAEIRKTKENPYFKSKYADLADVLAATVPSLSAAGLCLIQPPARSGEGGWTVHTILGHASGAYIEVQATIPAAAATDWQKFGSALTYCRRYQVSALLGVASEPDDDGNAATGEKGGPRQNTQPTPPAAPQKAQPAKEAPKAKEPEKVPEKPAPAKQTTLDEALKVEDARPKGVETAKEPPATASDYIAHEERAARQEAKNAILPAEPESKPTARIAPITDAQNAKAMELFSSRVWPRKNMEAGTIDPTVCDTREKRLLYLREVWNITDPGSQLTSEFQMQQVLDSLEKLPTRGPVS